MLGPELITLGNMPKELGLLSREKKSSISFSAVSFMVDTMQKLHSRITDKKPDVERAVTEEDMASLRSLCAEDEAAVAVAAYAAAREDREMVLGEVLDLWKGDARALSDPEEEGVAAVGGSAPSLTASATALGGAGGGAGAGGNLLHAACAANAPAAADALVRRGFDPNGWNRGGTATPMHCAAASGAVDLLRYLADHASGNLDAGADFPAALAADLHEGRPTVLQAAVIHDRREVVRFLLSRRVSKMKRARLTETALHTAARRDHHECARLLLDDGVLVDAQVPIALQTFLKKIIISCGCT